MPAPLPAEQRQAISDDIRAGLGCNATARKHHVSPSTVSGIARDEHLSFGEDWKTVAAVSALVADAGAARAEREALLIQELLTLAQAVRARDGRETKAHRRLSYRLYDLNRHHGRQSR